MENLKLGKQEFAKWLMKLCLTQENYWFDIFYDIPKLLKKTNEIHKPFIQTIFLYYRPTGVDFVDEFDENQDTYKTRSTKIFKIKFVFNYEYTNINYYAKIEQIQ